MGFERFRQRISAPSYYLGGNLAMAYADVTVTSAQLLALFATPITLVAAPGTGKAIIVTGVVIHKPAGTAYAGIAAGEDLSIKYTGAAGLELAGAETTGFLDSTAVQTRYLQPYRAASGVSEITPTANAVVVLHLLVAEITTGNSPLYVRTLYTVVPTVLP